MSAVIGILLDVSGSMQKNVRDVEDGEVRPWARSIFQVLDDLIKHDLAPENKVFAHAFGANCEKTIFDILGTVRKFQNKDIVFRDAHVPATHAHIEECFRILEQHGARTIRKWATKDIISSAIQDYMISLILSELKANASFRNHLIYDILPPACRDWADIPLAGDLLVRVGLAVVGGPWFLLMPPVNWLKNQTQDASAMVGSQFKQASEEDVRDVVAKVKSELLESPNQNSVTTVHQASKIVHGCIDNEELTTDRSKELHKLVEPFIYGRTPMYRSLKNSKNVFQSLRLEDGMKRMMFILSDGKPTDKPTNDLFGIERELKELDVTVVCCFVSKENVTQPKKLYSCKDVLWSVGAKFLFDLSSTVPTDILPRAILQKRKWDIEILNNETKLFMQVSHPENLKEACDLAKDIACSGEALSEILTSGSLDFYINRSRREFGAPYQEKDTQTCYANACAAVIHLSMKRIRGREGGYPDFEEIRSKIIIEYGKHSEKTFFVLRKVCSKYRLRSKAVVPKDALKAITEKRPVVATFYLSSSELERFDTFFKTYKTGILSETDIALRKPRDRAELIGHAVVLTSFNSQCLRLMNSWGEDWGDKGFFRVKNADVLHMKFFDVFWELEDLSLREKEFYAKHGSTDADDLMKSFIGLQKQTYKCPLSSCGKTSPVDEFTGTLSHAKCPRCGDVFSSNGDGNILALNIYLTTLAV